MSQQGMRPAGAWEGEVGEQWHLKATESPCCSSRICLKAGRADAEGGRQEQLLCLLSLLFLSPGSPRVGFGSSSPCSAVL